MKFVPVIFLLTLTWNLSAGFLAQIAARLPLPGNPSPPGSPWPLPQEWARSQQFFTLSSEEDFNYVLSVDCELLNRAVDRYNFKLLTQNSESVSPASEVPVLSTVYIELPRDSAQNLCSSYPRLNESQTYEYYEIVVDDKPGTQEPTVIISAQTVWGALRGLETFSQLIWRDRDWHQNHFFINRTHITDWPRYPHRGVMLDTARHFLSPHIIEQVLQAMAYNKLNVFHWHISDDQSFPFVSEKFPELSEKGAYIPGELIYDRETVLRIIEVARLRGIRVIFEFDTPGHTLVFGKAFPELLTPCYGDGITAGTPNYPKHAAYEILDPTKETTYTFIRELFTEVVQNVTKDELVHLGMDEVYYACWESSPEIGKFMTENNYTTYSQVQDHYTKKHLNMVRTLGARPIIWQDATDHDVELDTDVLVQVWKDDSGTPWQSYMQRLLDRGFSTILSSCWYLNYINYGESWRKYYECDPEFSLPSPLPDWQKKLILGGEAAIWAEYADGTNLVARLFPFAGAVAERLWSAPSASTTDDAMWRLDEHRCRMLGRGIQAQPIFNGYCFPQENHRPPI